MEIKASLVKELREITNAGMMECKNALLKCHGELEKAIKYLREQGLVLAKKKS